MEYRVPAFPISKTASAQPSNVLSMGKGANG